MLEEVLRHCNRLRAGDAFVRAVYRGEYTVEDGGIAPLALADGQYFYITGSLFNDGLHRYPADGLTGEAFAGEVWALALPKAFLDLAADMEAWQKKHGAAAASPYSSESFGGYSYSKASDVTVWSAFRDRLAEWRKV